MQELIFILLYAYDILFSYTLDYMQLNVLENLYQIGRLVANINKIKTVAIEPRHYPTLKYKLEQIQVVQRSKYPGINFPFTNRWNVCYESRVQASWSSYYMFENQCNKTDT